MYNVYGVGEKCEGQGLDDNICWTFFFPEQNKTTLSCVFHDGIMMTVLEGEKC